MTNILKIENLSKSYDKNLVLKNINLEIKNGEYHDKYFKNWKS